MGAMQRMDHEDGLVKAFIFPSRQARYRDRLGSDLDGREIDLPHALERTFDSFEGTFISCIPGRLAYYEREEMKERCVPER